MRGMDRRRRGEFMALWWASPNRIIRRLCQSCDDPDYKEIYYRRTNEDGMTRKILDIMIDGNFVSTNCVDAETCRTSNQCNVDFTLHSTYVDAKGGTEKWKQCCPNSDSMVLVSNSDLFIYLSSFSCRSLIAILFDHIHHTIHACRAFQVFPGQIILMTKPSTTLVLLRNQTMHFMLKSLFGSQLLDPTTSNSPGEKPGMRSKTFF